MSSWHEAASRRATSILAKALISLSYLGAGRHGPVLMRLPRIFDENSAEALMLDLSEATSRALY